MRTFVQRIKDDLIAALHDNASAFLGIRLQLQKKLRDTAGIPDAGERYLAIDGLGHDIQARRDAAYSEARDRFDNTIMMRNVINPAFPVGVGAVILGWIAMCVTATIGIAPIVLSGLCFAAGAVLWAGTAIWANRKLWPRFQQPAERMVDALKEPIENVQRQKTVLLRDHLPELAASKHFDELYDRFPAVRDAFVKATARATMAPAPEPALLKPAPNALKP